MIQIDVQNPEVYQRTEKRYDSHNFLQASFMAKSQKKRQSFLETECLAIVKDGEIVGQTVVNYRQRYWLFKEAIVFQGPLLNYDNLKETEECIVALEDYFKGKGVSRIIYAPYLVHRRIDTDLAVISDNVYQDLIDRMINKGYHSVIDPTASGRQVGQVFRKKLYDYATLDDLHEHYPAKLKRDIKKFKQSHVVVRELASDEVDIFYQIVEQTASRKGFDPNTLSYYQSLKEFFKDQVKFVTAFLDGQAYHTYLEENIDMFTKRLEELRNKEQSRKTKGLITDATDQLNSFLKRKQQAIELNIPTDRLIPLSSYVAITYGFEVILLAGGSRDAYINFGGSTLINDYLIDYAYENGYKYYNLYGTMEEEQSGENRGNFNYKRQFGGELNVLVGSFTKTLSKGLTLVEKIRGKA